MKSAKPQHGFLLLGLLIYVGLSLLILLACYQIALQLEWRNQQIQTRLRAEQNLSLAREGLVAAIAGAHLNNQGSLAGALTRLNLVNDPEQRMVLTAPVQVYGARDPIAASWGLTLPGSGQKAPDSMILVIRSIVGPGAKLAKVLKPGSSEIVLRPNSTVWQPGDFVVLSDAQRVLLDQIATVQASSQSVRVSLVKPIPFAMPVGSELNCYQFDAYYVGEDAASTTGLYRLNTQGQRQELFADIDQFTLAIGLYDRNTHIWRYIAPEYVKNWQELASIKLALGAQLPKDRAIKTSAVISLEGHG